MHTTRHRHEARHMPAHDDALAVADDINDRQRSAMYDRGLRASLDTSVGYFGTMTYLVRVMDAETCQFVGWLAA